MGVNKFDLTLYGGESLTFDQLEKTRLIRKLFWQGIEGHEPNTLRTFYALARHARMVFDVGAFFGLYGMVAAKANELAEIHCFEPFPDNVQLMDHLLDLNALVNVNSHQVAVSDSSGDATFFVPKGKGKRLPDIGSVKNRFDSGRFADREFSTIDVAAITLDGFCEQQGIEHVDLMKIDVEECELQVLEGAVDLLHRSKPDIICEVVFGNSQIPKIEEILTPLGYQYYVMEKHCLLRADGLDSYKDDGRQSRKGGYSDRLLSTRPEDELRHLLDWIKRDRSN